MKRVWLPMIGSVIVTIAAGPRLHVSAQSGGTIAGHVKLTGTPPPNAVIKMGADPNCLKINTGKRVVQQTVLRAEDGGLMNGFVNVKGSFPQVPAPPPASAVIEQQGCVYHPRVQGVRVGQTIEIKNSDATLHNIHSMSVKGNDFNVGQPLAGLVYKYQVKTEEVMLHVKCDVHSWMTGYVAVLPHPYFAVTDATGAFTIANVPAGKQTVQVWHEQYGALTQTVDVKPGATTTVDFAYTGNEKPPSLPSVPSGPSGFTVQELVVPGDASAVQLIAPTRP
ncbi:MAG TPA: carboxypeptidase regulatory-like domain-containing protein [Vicinamibacterales bacterium]|jgi:plastocyanin|nr:carboxypeptidase regulatory-like domain-containing protein [Vicinamibacterales bacterium]